MKRIMLAFLFASASAFGVEVSTVTQLTNELARINSGESSETTVTLAAGTYDLSTVCMYKDASSGAESALHIAKTIVLEGADATSWRNTADGDAKVVLDAGLARRVILVGANAVKTELRNLTIARGALCSSGAGVYCSAAAANRVVLRNCVVRNNVGATGNDNGSSVYLATARDCRFSGNSAVGGAGRYVMGHSVDFYDSLVECATNTYQVATGTIASNTTFRALRSSQWGTRALDYTKFIDCTVTNKCYGSFSFLKVASGGIVSGCTFTDLASPTAGWGNNMGLPVVDASGGTVFMTNCVFSGIRGASDGTCVRGKATARIVDCVFTNNTQVSGEKERNGGCVAGCSSALADMPVLVDCKFFDNAFVQYRATRAAACCYVSASNCLFVGNSTLDGPGAVYGGVYVKCVFRGNKTTGTDHAEYHQGGSAAKFGSYFGCTFEDNVDITTPTIDGNGASVSPKGGGTVVRASVVSNCVFRNNKSAQQGGAVAYCDSVVDTVISNCYATGYWNAAAYASSLSRCTITGAGRDVVTFGAVTNCLFYGISSADGADHSIIWRQPTEIVSCTIADIADSHMKTFNIYGSTKTAKNTIFRNIGGVSAILAGSTKLNLFNCFYDSLQTSATLSGCTQSTESPFIASNRPEYDPATPYAIRRWKKTLGQGLNDVGFTADDLDRAGNPRLRDGELDIGCYQCMIPPSGMVLLFR